MELFFLILIPLIVCGIMFFVFHTTITYGEFLLHVAISVAIVIIGFFIARHANMQSVEHLHGKITNKLHGPRSCCHCHQECTSNGKNTTCITVCSHSIDYYWKLDSTLGEIVVNSCKHSKRHPKIWEEAKIGEPATKSHSYTNYLKADRDSLLTHEEINKFNIPEFPTIYSLYKVNPILSSGIKIPDNWQERLREINAELGPKKEVDITLLLTNVQDPIYAQAVGTKWLYGPKNSLNIIVGVQNDIISWVRVVTISKVSELKIGLRDSLEGKNIKSDDILKIIHDLVNEKFVRTPMSQYEYLSKSVKIKTGWLIGLALLNLFVSIGLGLIMHYNDVV